MTDTAAIEAELLALFRSVLLDPTVTIAREEETGSHPGWDSMANVEILIGVEERWGFEFRSDEIDRIRSFGDLIDAVAAHAG